MKVPPPVVSLCADKLFCTETNSFAVDSTVLNQILDPLDILASESTSFIKSPLVFGKTVLPRFICVGQRGGGDPIKIGLFAGIHGDEQTGSQALVELAMRISSSRSIAEGYQLVFYPICNPTGFANGTRFSMTGKDLNREFWKNSSEPEVRLLENEIVEQKFNGLISLHSDDTSEGVYGFVRGDVLAKSLLEPALKTAERFLPRNLDKVIDGFAAENGIISECYEGILTSPPKLNGSPFEIILETPHHAAPEAQVNAFVTSIISILSEYRKFLAFAADL